MIGTLIKTTSIKGLFIGIVEDFIIDNDDSQVVVDIVWHDNDKTTEVFDREDIKHDEYEYAFYGNGRWWSMSEYYYDFQRLLDRK